MSEHDSDPTAIDRTALSVGALGDNSDEIRYWHSRSPLERLRHVELLRQINYGYRADEGLQRVLEVVPRPWR